MVPEDAEVSTVNFGGDVPDDDRDSDDDSVKEMQYTATSKIYDVSLLDNADLIAKFISLSST